MAGEPEGGRSEQPPSASENPSTAATCPRHPGAVAVGTCRRCGTFVCETDQVVVAAERYCPDCSALPEVDPVLALRERCWGRRDAWAWVVGLGAVLPLLAAGWLVALKLGGNPRASGRVAAEAAAYALVGLCFFSGLRWARHAMLAMSFGPLAVMGWLGLDSKPGTFNVYAMFFLALSTVFAIVSIAIYRSTRNKLFFRIAVPRADLESLWRARGEPPVESRRV